MCPSQCDFLALSDWTPGCLRKSTRSVISLADYHVLPILTSPNIGNSGPYGLLNVIDILLSFQGQLGPRPHSARTLLPAFKVTVVNGIIQAQVCGKTRQRLTFRCNIRCGHPDYGKRIQHVKLGQVDSYIQKSACLGRSRMERIEVFTEEDLTRRL